MIKYVIIVMVYLAIGTASAILASAYSGDELREEVIGAIVFAWPVIGFLLVFLRFSAWLAETVNEIGRMIREEADDD